MKATKITLEMTKNLGNYENIRYTLEVELEEGEKVDFSILKEKIEREHKRCMSAKNNK